MPKDNIHPSARDRTFSSRGCLTVRGRQGRGSHAAGTATGEWRAFRRKADFDGTRRGTRYDVLLATGHEASAVAAIGAAPQNDLTCLRHGSRGMIVRDVQRFLGVNEDGVFGAGTKKNLTLLQQESLGFATGTWTPEMAALLRGGSDRREASPQGIAMGAPSV